MVPGRRVRRHRHAVHRCRLGPALCARRKPDLVVKQRRHRRGPAPRAWAARRVDDPALREYGERRGRSVDALRLRARTTRTRRRIAAGRGLGYGGGAAHSTLGAAGAACHTSGLLWRTACGSHPAAAYAVGGEGWFDAAAEWMQGSLAELGYAATGPVEQVRNWAISSLLPRAHPCGNGLLQGGGGSAALR